MIAIIAAAVLSFAPAKAWHFELTSPVGTATFDLAAMPSDGPVAVSKFEASKWYGQQVESIALDPIHREGRLVTIRLKGSDRPLVLVFESFDVTTGNKKPRAVRVGLRCSMAVARI